MGSGCSSPLRRLGGKKSKPADRNSVSTENNDNLDQMTIAARMQQQESDTIASNQYQQGFEQAKLNLENEITIQSEAADDHPSSASYYTDGRHQCEENKSSNVEQQQTDSDLAQISEKHIGPGAAAARIMGLGACYAPHDRHLLVSPALSPAPSVCQSPAPNSSILGGSVKFDLSCLDEAFKTLTFGLPNNQPNEQSINQQKRPQSELYNQYAKQLVQNQEDLTNYITIAFITTDNSFVSFDYEDQATKMPDGDVVSNFAIDMEKQITSHLRAICDEHSYNLRFLNLSHDHLSKNILVNNLGDVAKNIFKQEYEDNSERFIVVILANCIGNISFGSSNEVGSATTDLLNSGIILKQNDKRLLPTKIDAQLMNTLLDYDSTNLDQKAKDLLKLWYTQVNNIHYLNPIYSVYPDALDDSVEKFSAGWNKWLEDSNILIKALTSLCDSDTELSSSMALKSLSNIFIEFITKEGQLQKRTLLIRNYPQSSIIIANQQQQPIVTTQSVTMNKGSLSELARQLADPNKLTIKRVLGKQELINQIDDWIAENFSKFIDCFLENRIIHDKYAPPFIVKNLFVELTKQRLYLEYFLNNITDPYESKCQNFYTSQIRPITTRFIDSTTDRSDFNADTLITTSSTVSGSHQSIVTPPPANHLVLIFGPKGCGKTTLFAQIIKFTAQDLLNKAQIIYRFCGSTLNTLTPNRLLLSICEQFCQAQGENTAAASYIYSSRRDIMISLNKILKQQNCLIFLDGLDTFDHSDETCLDWLCELEASNRIKIFIMLETDSSLYKRALESYTDATFISLDNPTISQWAQMLTQTAKAKCLNCATNLYDEINNLGSIDPVGTSSVTYLDVDDTLNMCQIRRLNNEYIYPELLVGKSKQSNPSIFDYKNVIHHGVLRHLHYLLAPYQLCSLFIAFNSSRNGLSEQDLIGIMNLTISRLQQRYSDTRKLNFSSSLLSYLKIQLKPWLRYIICVKVVKLTLRKDFCTKALEYYLPSRYPKLLTEVREILLEYFSQPFRQSKQKSGSKGLDVSPKVHVSRAEAIWIETQVSESMNLLLLTNPTKAREYIMNKDYFYLQFLNRTNPEEFLEDYDRIKLVPSRKASQTNEELSILVNFIRQSIFPLRYDGSQIYSQIYCRSYETNKSSAKSRSKKFNEILVQASYPPMTNLLPISETSIISFIRTRIGLNEPPATTTSTMSITSAQSTGTTLNQKTVIPSSAQPQKQSLGPPAGTQQQQQLQQQQQQQQCKQKIFTIKDNHRHVIIVYPDKNCLSVWDIFDEKAVRTINNVDQPRDLRMVDQKRAVVLCNRELRVYDLDSGQMLTKLKGVMNQKMPYFEVFGQDYVIALSRNRMYVNMLNLNTGELETTFKVGEDRFLNSLLVSANGGICVCGDETQKPFPLLVWNLNERRLMYDLRLDRHEFITRMSAISDDGHFVVSVCKQIGGASDGLSSTSSCSTPPNNTGHKPTSPNFIVIYDLNSGTLFKKWKPGLDTCAVAISLSANRSGKVMNTIVDSTILVWDLATGSKRHTLTGHSSPADVITVQNGRLFSMDSTCRDQSLRIWDIDEGYCLAVFSPDAPVSCSQLSTRGDALVCGFAAETRLSTLVLCRNESVGDIVKRNKRRKSSKSLYIFDESPNSRKQSS